MRLTQHEIRSIKKAFEEVFEGGKIYLFGSRKMQGQRFTFN